ncbi:MAG: TraM recognition domain-containing protein [Pseudomonadota bacterium]|nr:TraM recognition domain-containing protein [Pseudomonadota bacterium]
MDLGWGKLALADVPSDLDKDAVRGSVMENCAIQLSYRIKDPETAEWLAASTGTILVDDESRKIEKNLALTETVSKERTVRQAERYYIDTNMLMNMPRGCGLLVGAGKLPSFCYTSPVKVERSEAAITPTIPVPALAVVEAPATAAPGSVPGLVAVEEEDF